MSKRPPVGLAPPLVKTSLCPAEASTPPCNTSSKPQVRHEVAVRKAYSAILFQDRRINRMKVQKLSAKEPTRIGTDLLALETVSGYQIWIHLFRMG